MHHVVHPWACRPGSSPRPRAWPWPGFPSLEAATAVLPRMGPGQPSRSSAKRQVHGQTTAITPRGPHAVTQCRLAVGRAHLEGLGGGALDGVDEDLWSWPHRAELSQVRGQMVRLAGVVISACTKVVKRRLISQRHGISSLQRSTTDSRPQSPAGAAWAAGHPIPQPGPASWMEPTAI